MRPSLTCSTEINAIFFNIDTRQSGTSCFSSLNSRPEPFGGVSRQPKRRTSSPCGADPQAASVPLTPPIKSPNPKRTPVILPSVQATPKSSTPGAIQGKSKKSGKGKKNEVSHPSLQELIPTMGWLKGRYEVVEKGFMKVEKENLLAENSQEILLELRRDIFFFAHQLMHPGAELISSYGTRFLQAQRRIRKPSPVLPLQENGTLGSFLASLGTKKEISPPKEPYEALWSSIESLKNDTSLKGSVSLTLIRLAAFTSRIKITTALNGYEEEDFSQDEKTVVKQQLTIFGPTFSSRGTLEKLFIIIGCLGDKWKFG